MSIISRIQCKRGQHQYIDKDLHMKVIKEFPDKTIFRVSNKCIHCGVTEVSKVCIPNKTWQ